MKIIKDKNRLSKPCRLVSEDEMGAAEQLGKDMLEHLNSTKDGIGLAANQVGSDLSVIVMNVKGNVTFINPILISGQGEVIARESCLSFPGKRVATKRYQHIVVDTANHGRLYFYAPQVGDSLIREHDFLECICMQHEMDHLIGKTMYDVRIVTEHINPNRRYGRNERVVITDGKTRKELKYKKAEPLINTGDWRIWENLHEK